MAKITISDLTAAFASTTALNAKFQQIEDALNNLVLYRDNTGTPGEPNSMAQDLDMSNNDILNLPAPSYNNSPARLQDVINASTSLTSTTAVTTSVADTGGRFTATNAETVLAELFDNSLTVIKTVVNKAEAVLITPTTDKTLFVDGTDGGFFRSETGAPISTYADNGGAYCGTVFIPTGGDGSSAWIRVYSGEVHAKWFGAKEDKLVDDTAQIQKCIDSGEDIIVIKNSKITGQVYVDSSQTIFIDGDIYVDWAPSLVSATFETAMDTTVFVNRNGFTVAKAFITGLAAPKAFITAVNSSGNFLPNENHTATANGEFGISIIQRSGRIYSDRARYSDTVGPYAFIGLFITEKCQVELNNITDFGAGVWGYHMLNSKFEVSGEDIGTDLNQSTSFLGGSFGALICGKAVCWNNEMNANALNCNDVVTLDGLCRSNYGVISSRVDSTDIGAENHRVYELSDNSRSNIFDVTASYGGEYEHVVFQDTCSENITKLASHFCSGRGVNLRRDCNDNKFDITVREWDKVNLGLGAIELFQSGTSEGCKDNDIDIAFTHATAGKKVIREIVADVTKPHLDNNYFTDKGKNSATCLADFVDTNGNYENGALLLSKDRGSSNFYGESSLITAASTTITISQQGITSLASIRPLYDSQIRGFRCTSEGTISAGQIDITVEVFRTTWVVLDTLTLNSVTDSDQKRYRDMVAFYADTVDESIRIRAATDVSFVGSTNIIFGLELTPISVL